MRFVIADERPEQARADVVVLYLAKRERRPGAVQDAELADSLARVIDEEGFAGEEGDTLLWHAPETAPARRYLVVGLGNGSRPTLETVRKFAAIAARRLESFKPGEVALSLPGFAEGTFAAQDCAQAAVEGAILGSYRFDRYFTGERQERRRVSSPSVVRLLLPGGDVAAAEQGAEVGRVHAEATAFARDLVSEPGIEMTPARVAEVAREAASDTGLELKVLETKDMEELGMGALLGVAAGSVEPPKLVHLSYRGPGEPRAHVALVGKGITFDSGGLSLKPSNAMEKMKTDKAGAMAVLAVLRALPRLQLPIHVEGVLALAENMPSGSAIRPGDVLTSMSGTTIEVNNTDAEGRLVLCDALEYIQRLGVDRILDLATLTGACVVALGPLCTGVMGNDEGIRQAVVDAADEAGEKAWPLPLYPEYLSQLESEIADLKNTGERWGGALTAGLFLKEFVRDDLPWAHLDIAGPSYAEKDHWLSRKGATGAGVRTVLRYLASL